MVLAPPVAALESTDRLPERAGAAVVRVGNGDNAAHGGDVHVRLHGCRAGRLGRHAQRGVSFEPRRRRVGHALQRRVELRKRAGVGQRSTAVSGAGQAGGTRE